jgi:hypothetical protein
MTISVVEVEWRCKNLASQKEFCTNRVPCLSGAGKGFVKELSRRLHQQAGFPHL